MSTRYVWGRYGYSTHIEPTTTYVLREQLPMVGYDAGGVTLYYFTVEHGTIVNGVFVPQGGEEICYSQMMNLPTNPPPYRFSNGTVLVSGSLEWTGLYFATMTGQKMTGTQTVADKGELLGTSTSNIASAYPQDGVSGSFWYTYQGEDHIDPTEWTMYLLPRGASLSR